MRIATGGYAHETNSFGSILVDRKYFQKNLHCGAESYFESYSGVRNSDGGVIDQAKELGIELIPTLRVTVMPCGPTVQDVFEEYRDELVETLWDAHCESPLDGIALCMHGAGVVQGYPDLEGETLRAIRERFGPEIPIGIALDLHGNISPEMLQYADIICGYKSYPHVDAYETSRTMVKLLHDMILQGHPHGKALVRLPWHIASAFGLTLSGPGHEMQQLMARMVAEEPDLLDATFFHGFPYADVSICGASVVTCARTQEAAERFAKIIADHAWSLRHTFQAATYSAAQVMDMAEQAKGPVVINESSDNPGGGTPGDGTHLLREMLKRNIPGSCFGFIYDPQVARQAVEAGVGSRIDCILGGKSDSLHGEPLHLKDAYVKCISDGRFIQKNPMGKGDRCNWGPMVLLVVGNVKIVVACDRTQTKDDAPFYLVGIDWRSERILALKSSHHFRGWWQDQVETIITCDSPGVHSADLSSFDFKHLNREYFPFRNIER